MSGRFSVQYEANHKPQAIHANFTWSQTPQQTVVTLSSATGQTLAILSLNAHGAQLKLADKPPQFASDANQLLLDMLGWPLPVTSLQDWLQGFINDAHSQPITEAIAGDTYFVDGWMLRYTAWTKEDDQTERPKRLDLTRQTEQAGSVSLRIVIDEWDGQ